MNSNAGIVEARGRTGRPSTAEERAAKLDPKEQARLRREERMNREPTWKGALNRAGIATIVFVALVLLLFRQPVASAVMLGAFMLLIYIPLGYYTDLWIWRRRQRKKAVA